MGVPLDFKHAERRADADGHGHCSDHLGNTRNAHATTVAQALVHERVSPLLWPHHPLALAWVPTSGTQDPTCAARSHIMERRSQAHEHTRTRTSIAHIDMHGAAHAHSKAKRASTRPLDMLGVMHCSHDRARWRPPQPCSPT